MKVLQSVSHGLVGRTLDWRRILHADSVADALRHIGSLKEDPVDWRRIKRAFWRLTRYDFSTTLDIEVMPVIQPDDPDYDDSGF